MEIPSLTVRNLLLVWNSGIFVWLFIAVTENIPIDDEFVCTLSFMTHVGLHNPNKTKIYLTR